VSIDWDKVTTAAIISLSAVVGTYLILQCANLVMFWTSTGPYAPIIP
jgi:hypothetical protein